jgi:hypothetical protein
MNDKKRIWRHNSMFFHTLWITFEVQMLTMDKLGLLTLAFD